MAVQWTAHYAGDSALVIEFGKSIERQIVDQVNALDALIQSAISADTIHGITETVPTFRSLSIIYDSGIVHPDELIQQLRTLASDGIAGNTGSSAARQWRLPVLYGTEQGPDLAEVSRLTGLGSEEIIELHVNSKLVAYMLGFLPGYAFLGDTPDALHLPRRTEPRLQVPAGSVAIAMQLTGIYPWDSPGGWHILGNCPVPMFDASMSPPALLTAGDTVSFMRIDEAEFRDLKSELASSSVDRRRWQL